MKSAFEKAMERIDQLEEPDEHQRLRWRLVPDGRQLAVAYLKGQGSALSDIANSPESHKPHLIHGMIQVLASNLQLPRNQAALDTTNRALDASERLLVDVPEAKELLRRIRYISDQYRQFGLPQREQSYQQLKQQIQRQVTETMMRQMNPSVAANPAMDVESMPEFQQSWMRLSGQLDQQYEQHMEESRKQLLELT